MTKSTITREQLEEWVAQFDEDGGCDATDRQLEALIRHSLAALDSGPVAEVVSIYGDPEAFGEREIRPLVGIQQMPYGTKLYRHAQPAPEYPEVLPCSVLLEPGLRFGKGIKTSTMLAALSRRDVYESDLAALSPEERVEFQAGIEDVKALIAQPATAFPDFDNVLENLDYEARCNAWESEHVLKACQATYDACRAAMLQVDNSPAQSDCCPAQNSVAPAKSPIDHGYRPECECSGCKATARICDELSANSSANPDCWCRTCRPVVLNDMRFVVCPDCGNKRCPRANDHRNACTGSNEPGQEGSAYPDTPQLPGSEPATVPGKWIPVSERMPEAEGHYLVWANASRIDGYCDHLAIATYQGREWSNEFNWLVTHWMPLPAAPQEDINALIPLVSRNEPEGK
ncbi:Eaa1 [Klebsiella pneumoniae]|nr:Eaa1 [Klebsiella pneumoniae]SYS70137.1 Eaa1 [Klebsiella pneumoniae]